MCPGRRRSASTARTSRARTVPRSRRRPSSTTRSRLGTATRQKASAALRDPAVRAVICTRGGYGTQRIVDAVPFEALRDDPKLLVGFSDVTALHLAVWRRAQVATLYAPGLAWNDTRLDAGSAESLRSAMME